MYSFRQSLNQWKKNDKFGIEKTCGLDLLSEKLNSWNEPINHTQKYNSIINYVKVLDIKYE